MKVLVIDVGGTHVKILATGQKAAREFESAPRMTPEQMVAGVKTLAGAWRYDAVSVGYPGAVLHNRPQQIVIAAERAVASALASGRSVALAYADCGSYGALDELCARYGVRRLPGLHCYDVFAGADRIAAMFDAEPGTYVLTDFLLRSFDRSVLAELGLDRYPELWDDYFGHYTRLVWLAQEPSPALEAEADRVAGMFGLPLTRVDVGVSRLEQALQEIL